MENNKNPKAVIYCRVSTKEQVEEGNSLTSQERNCREYAQKHGFEILRIFIEEGESAKTADRTELQKLLRFCSDRKQNINAVIIYKIDRLSRNTDDYSQLRLLLKRYGVEIKSTSEYFENTPAGRFMENIIANVAQFDNDVRTERSIGGMKDAARDGRYVWIAPVGYVNSKVNGKSNIVKTEKAELVKLAFEMMAERKYTINAIRETLAVMGLKMAKSQFYKMLKNEVYIGWICKFGEKNKGKYEPVITEALFYRVQQVMNKKRLPILYKTQHPDFPLRRFVKDLKGEKLTGAWSAGRAKKYAYYRFIKAGQQFPKGSFETSFLSYFDKYSFNESLLQKLKNHVLKELSDVSDKNTVSVTELISRKGILKEKQNALVQKNLSGVISDSLLREQLGKIDEELWTIERFLSKREETKIDTKTVFDYLDHFLLHPADTWQKLPFESKIKLQWFVFPEGVLFDGNKFQTTKISSLYKLKRFFLSEMSPTVHHPRLSYKHTELANSPSLQDEENIAWIDIKTDLQNLQEVLSNNESQAH